MTSDDTVPSKESGELPIQTYSKRLGAMLVAQALRDTPYTSPRSTTSLSPLPMPLSMLDGDWPTDKRQFNHGEAICSIEELEDEVRRNGIDSAVARYGYGSRQAVHNRLNRARRRGAKTLKGKARHHLSITDGQILIGSDAHYRPGLRPSTAHSAFVRLVRGLAPKAVILNGDIIDAPSVSKHARIGWEAQPKLMDEIEEAQARLGEIEAASIYPKPPYAELIWTFGNHDARFETYLANNASQYAGIAGVHLKDHFPAWIPCWGVHINDQIVVKHRFKRAIHAPYSNTLFSGRTVVTGHLHSLNVAAFSDYDGARWGVDGGTLAVPYGEQFTDYTEDNPVDWRSGFVVLTFVKGKLLWPELLWVYDEAKRITCFRGELHKEDK